MAEGTPGERIGRRVRAVREHELYTRPELAKRSGVAIPTIEALEGGLVTRPRRTTVEKLAEALGVGVKTLMDAPEDAADVPLGATLQRSEDAFVVVGRIVTDETGNQQRQWVVKWNVPPEERGQYRAFVRKLTGGGDYTEEEMSPEAAEVLLAAAV